MVWRIVISSHFADARSTLCPLAILEVMRYKDIVQTKARQNQLDRILRFLGIEALLQARASLLKNTVQALNIPAGTFLCFGVSLLCRFVRCLVHRACEERPFWIDAVCKWIRLRKVLPSDAEVKNLVLRSFCSKLTNALVHSSRC